MRNYLLFRLFVPAIQPDPAETFTVHSRSGTFGEGRFPLTDQYLYGICPEAVRWHVSCSALGEALPVAQGKGEEL